MKLKLTQTFNVFLSAVQKTTIVYPTPVRMKEIVTQRDAVMNAAAPAVIKDPIVKVRFNYNNFYEILEVLESTFCLDSSLKGHLNSKIIFWYVEVHI